MCISCGKTFLLETKIFYLVTLTLTFDLLFSSPESKAQVSYCHSAPFVVRPSVVRPSVNFHIFIFSSRTAWWNLMKLGRDEVLMVPYKCCCFSARSAQGRIQGGSKIGQKGSPSSRNFFFEKLLLQTWRLQWQTKWIAMTLKHVGNCVVIFGSIPKSNFWRVLTSFWT